MDDLAAVEGDCMVGEREGHAGTLLDDDDGHARVGRSERMTRTSSWANDGRWSPRWISAGNGHERGLARAVSLDAVAYARWKGSPICTGTSMAR